MQAACNVGMIRAVGLGDCYLVLEEYAGTPASETLPKAKAAVESALQVDDTLVEAHTSYAMVMESLWQWDEAEREFKRAISLNPNYPTTHHWYAIHLYTQRRFDEALAQAKRAQELDPLSPIIGEELAVAYLLTGNADAAVEQCKKVIDLNPSFPVVYAGVGIAYYKQQKYQEMIAAFQKEVELSANSSGALADLASAYAASGRRSEALKILRELEARYSRRETPGFNLALVTATLGDADATFRWLGRDVEEKGTILPYVVWDPRFDALRNDARYKELLRRMGLQP